MHTAVGFVGDSLRTVHPDGSQALPGQLLAETALKRSNPMLKRASPLPETLFHRWEPMALPAGIAPPRAHVALPEDQNPLPEVHLTTPTPPALPDGHELPEDRNPLPDVLPTVPPLPALPDGHARKRNDRHDGIRLLRIASG